MNPILKRTLNHIPNEEGNDELLSVSSNSSDESNSDVDVEVQQQPISTKQANKAKRKRKYSDVKPLLAFIQYTNKEAEDRAAKDSNRSWVCKLCTKGCKSSYTRIFRHFFGHKKGKSNVNRCKVMLNDPVQSNKVIKAVKDAEKLGVSSTLKESIITKKPKNTNPLQAAFGMLERDVVDQSIMRFLCANGISFNVLRSPQFSEMINTVRRAPAGYKPPGYEKARTTLLDECKRDVEKELAPIKDTWGTQGVSIVSDGWSNVKNEPLINVIAENSRGAMFMNASDFSGVVKTGAVISDYLLNSIDEVGPSNVVQVITDNASNCVSAGKEIEKIHKHIFWSPCVVHTMNLLFKDFGKEFMWLSNTYKKGKAIVKYVSNHQNTLAMFRSFSHLELLKVAETRFGSHYIFLKRLLDCREALVILVCQKKWKEWVKVGDENSRKTGNDVAAYVKDETFWEEVENILKILTPLYHVLKFADGEGHLMGEIYEKMDTMLGEVNDVMAENRYSGDFDKMEQFITQRWEKMNVPIHCLGFALNPRFYNANYLRSKAPGGVKRKAPNLDKEVMTGMMKSFEKLSMNREEETKLRGQFATFHMKKGLFGMKAAQEDAMTMDAVTWWSSYGSETPELAQIAIKILSQPISISSAERNWSTYKFIHSVVRNRLNNTRAEKLVFIHSNLRLISRFTIEYQCGDYKKWDVEPHNPTLEISSIRLQDMAWDGLDLEF